MVVIVRAADAVIVDPESLTVKASLPLPDVPQINAVLLTGDSLWVTDHDGGRVIRVDRESGEAIAEIALPSGRAVSLVETKHGIWAGHAHVVPEGVALIDPATNEIARTIDEGAFPTPGLGSLWFGKGTAGVGSDIRRVDPESGEVIGRIDDTQGCYVGGEFPEVVWSFCHQPNVDSYAVRLDVDSLKAAKGIPLGGEGGLIGVAGGRSWFDTWEADGSIRLLAIDNRTNTIVDELVFASGTVVGIVGGDLWIIDPSASLWRLPLAGA